MKMSKKTIRLMVMGAAFVFIGTNIDAFGFDVKDVKREGLEDSTARPESVIRYEKAKDDSLNKNEQKDVGYLAPSGDGNLIGPFMISIGAASNFAGQENEAPQDLATANGETSDLLDESGFTDQDGVAGVEMSHADEGGSGGGSASVMGGNKSQDNAVDFESETIAPAGPGLERKSAIISRGF